MAETYYSGRVQNVVYSDSTQAFFILKMLLDADSSQGGQLVSVKGHVPGMGVDIGTWFGFEARWVDAGQYGKQLQITKAPVLKNGWDDQTIIRMLSANGVPEVAVRQVHQHWKGDLIKALSSEEMLCQVAGMTQFTAEHMIAKWQHVQTYFRVLTLMSDMGLPPGKVREVWRVFGDDAEKVLTTNPWALTQIEGIKFEQADEIAKRLGLDLGNPLRVEGAVLSAIKAERNSGHMYLTSSQIAGLQSFPSEALGKSLVSLHKQALLVLDKTNPDRHLGIYDPWLFQLEDQSSKLLASRTTTAQPTPQFLQALKKVGPQTASLFQGEALPELETVAAASIEEWASQANLGLSANQKKGVLNSLIHPVSILTGLPGTGKTVSTRATVRILQDAEIPFLLCAPTGIAAKRLESVTGARAYTIHRAFGAQGSSDSSREFTYAGIVGDQDGRSEGGYDGEWEYNEDKPHPAQVVIIDESSMLDQHLLFRILTCTMPECRLVFVGDHAQLPSVGPGNVLRDLIQCAQFPVVRLTDIFRQEDTSGIVGAAHSIHRGEVPVTGTKGDFMLIPTSSDEETRDVVTKLAKILYDKRAEFQILSPRHAGLVGVTSLNQVLREILNPQQAGLAEYKIGEDVIRENDRVMVTKNDYTLGIFNGDVGKVSRIDRKNKIIEIKIFGPTPMLVEIQFSKAAKTIRLAYACTVHKSQGLEYDHIVIPVVDSFNHQLQRNLYYTAVTRARKKVVLVGSQQAFAKAVLNSKEDERNTMFRYRILKELCKGN